MSNRVTIKSIAQDLGISHMTVSRALSNNPKVRENTRKAVIKHAQELGYVKSVAATTMRGDQTTIVGLLLPNLVNEFYARFANSLATYIEDHGLQLIIHLTNDDINKERESILKLREIQAHAVVMVPAPGLLGDEQKYLKDLQIIQLMRKRELRVPSREALVDDTGAIVQAVQHLASQGHTRIAYIGGEKSLSSGYSRMSAFITGMAAARLVPSADEIITDMPSFLMGHQSVQAIIDDGNVTAIICGGFEISNGALNGCLERGMHLPGDIAFVGYGDPSYYRWMSGGISTIKIEVDSLAAKTTKLLTQRGSANKDGLAQQLLMAELVIRQSSLAADKLNQVE